MQAAAYNRHQAAPTASGAITQVSVSFGESVNSDLLRQSWQVVMERHPILRSALFSTSDGVMVREADKAEPTWVSLDWQSVSPDDISSKWNGLLASDAATEFEAIAVPLVRFHDIRLPGGGGHYLLTTPSFLLDEFSLTRVLLDLLLTMGQCPLAPQGEMPTASKGKDWDKFLTGVSAPMSLESRADKDSRSRASLLLDREKSAIFSKFCLNHDLEESLVLRCLWSLLLRRLGANGNLMLSLFDARGDSSEAGYFQNWLPIVQSWTGSVRDWLDNAQSLSDKIAENTWVNPDQPLRAAGVDFLMSDIHASFSWRTSSINNLIHTALPRWINFDAAIQQRMPSGLVLEACPGPRLELALAGPFANEAAAKQILSRLVGMLVDLPNFYEKPVDRLPILIPEEIQTIRDWSRGPELTEQPSSVLEAFRKVAANHAGEVAVRFGDYSMTYSELDSLSDKMASHLSQLGLAGGWHVGLVLSPSAWIGVALLGAWKAGNSCLAIDPTAPMDWVDSKLVAHDVAVVICDKNSEPHIDGSVRRRIVIDQDWDSLELALLDSKEILPDQLAATIPGHVDGEPPLVRALTHNMLVSAAAEGARILDFKAGDTFLVRSMPGGGAFFDEWIIPLLCGGTVFVASDDLLESATAPVTHMRLTTPEWANQASAWARGATHCSPTLRVVAIEGGSPLVNSFKVWAQQLTPPIRQVVFFSPVGLCGLGLAGLARRDTAILPLGKPTAEIEVSVCDADGLDLPIGYSGSVFLKFPGWKNLPDATGRLGINLGLTGWRDASGDLHLESVGRHVNGIPTAAQRLASLPFVPESFDVFINNKGTFILSDRSVPNAVSVNEWLLNRAGWIDEAALPKVPETVAPVAASPKQVVVPTPKTPQRKSKEAWTPITKMQEGTGGELLVFVHAADGSPDIYRHLIRALGPSRRILGITARGADNPDACHPSIESAAAQYLAAIFEEERPHTWKLAGFGFGGTVALEMTRQLQAAGRTVPDLVIMGSVPPFQEQKPAGWMDSVRKVFKKITTSERIEPSASRSQTAIRHEAAWKNYRLKSCEVEATIVIPADIPEEIGITWQEVLPNATVEFTKSNWSDMLNNPAVKRLSSIINNSETPELF